MATRVKPIPLRLNPDIEFEAALRVQYDARPRARRQEFLRQILRLGWDAWQQGMPPAAPAPAPQLAAREVKQAAAPLPAAAQPAPVPASAAPAPAEPIGESSKALKGFFGEVHQ